MIKIKKYQIEDYISDATQDALDLKADLVNGKVPASQLPSFVDDVIEVANYAALPIPGATGVIYITLDTNKVYRWTGSVYVEIASGVTNLSYTPGVSNGTVNSDTGSDAIIPLAGTVNSGLFSATEKSKLDGIAPNANVGVIPNAPITGATKTKITYDNKGLVTAGADATTADIADSTNKRYVTDANLTVINNTSGTNTGDQGLQSVTDIGATTTNPITITIGEGGLTGISSTSSQGYGIRGESSETIAVYGTSISTGVYGQGNVGVHAYSADGTGIEVYGNGGIGISVNLGNSNKGLVINSGASSTGNPIEIIKSDDVKFTINQQGEQSIVKIPGGLSTEYLMADGTTTTGGTGGGGIPHATASGTDTYTATVSGVTSYSDGDAYLIRFPIGNTTVATLNINALGAIPLYRNNDGPLIGGDVQANGEMLCVYNSTANTFQCIGTSPNSIISYVTNADSVTITKGQVVYAFGGTGDRMTVKLASNIGDSTSAQTVGIVLSTSIAANQKGFIIFQGLLDNLSILPTATWADGDPVYLGATAGSITKVKPYAPNHLVYIGIVTTASNGGAGRMYVRVQNGYELDELHNVQAQTPTLKDTLWYDNTVSPAQWKTASISSILGYTPANDANVVHLTGNETISGQKTFTDNLTAGRYLYNGGSIFPEFGHTFYINGTASTHYFGGGTSNAQNNLEVSNGTLKIGLQTASTIASFDANKNVVSLTTANGYPTLTELKSLVGVSTTAIQTQLNSKQASNANLTGLSALTHSGSIPFVRMYAPNLFSLDTSTYLTSVGIANLTATGTPSATTYLRGDNTWATVTAGGANLGYTPSPTNGTVTNSNGTPAILPLADGTNAGLLKPAKFTVLENTSGTNTGDQDLSNLVVKNAAITGATNTKITYDAKGLVTAGTSLIATDIPTITQAQVTNLTTDLAAKAPLASPTFTGTPSLPTGTIGVTQTAGDNSTKIATTAFVASALSAGGVTVSPQDTFSTANIATVTAAQYNAFVTSGTVSATTLYFITV